MTYPRRIWALLALALTLMLGACSTPDDLNAPVLEPQFGSANTDIGVDVAFVSTGRIYSLWEQQGNVYETSETGESYPSGRFTRTHLTLRDSSGKLIWNKEIESIDCDYDDGDDDFWNDEYHDIYDCGDHKTTSLYADKQGYLHVVSMHSFHSPDRQEDVHYYDVAKFDATGKYIQTLSDETPNYSRAVDIAVDGSGNIYMARERLVHESYGGRGTAVSEVVKTSPSGTLLWSRTSTVGVPYGITLSSTGSVYVVGSAGIARYTNSGNLNWTKPGNFEEVMISGSNIYARYRTSIFKYDGSGTQLWKRTQSGLTTPSIADMTGDGSGNVYLTGKYNASSTDRNAFIRKLNSSGSVLWTKTYGTTNKYDDALGIATINGSEIYTNGSTQGSLAHTNRGGSDGYLRKMSLSGSLLWIR